MTALDPHTRPCPACHHIGFTRPVYHATFAPIAGVTAINSYSVGTCPRCGMLFAKGIPSQEDLDAYYATSSKYTAVSAEDQKRHELTLSLLLRNTSPAKNPNHQVADIGSGAGGLAPLLEKAGWTVVNVPDGATLERLATGRHIFQGAVLSGVLEHIADVDTFLANVADLLCATDGWLHVEVPYLAYWVAASSAPFQEFSSEHINFFGPRTLGLALERHGFRVVSVTHNVVRQAPGQSSPNLVMFARFDRDRDTRSALRYIEHSRDIARMRWQPAFAGLPGEFVVWGCGTVARRLWERLEASGAVLATDSNTAYHGHTIGHTRIVPPAEAAVTGLPVVIVVSSDPAPVMEQATDAGFQVAIAL